MSEENEVFYAEPSAAKSILESMTGGEVDLADYDDDEVSGFQFRPLMPTLGGGDSPLRPLNAQDDTGTAGVNASMWPIPKK